MNVLISITMPSQRDSQNRFVEAEEFVLGAKLQFKDVKM